MKYIIFDNKYPVLFPDEIIHCTVSAEGMKPTSAGHAELESGMIRVFGESETLGIHYESGDATMIYRLLEEKIK